MKKKIKKITDVVSTEDLFVFCDRQEEALRLWKLTVAATNRTVGSEPHPNTLHRIEVTKKILDWLYEQAAAK